MYYMYYSLQIDSGKMLYLTSSKLLIKDRPLDWVIHICFTTAFFFLIFIENTSIVKFDEMLKGI